MYFKVHSSLLACLCWKLLIVLITQLTLLFCLHALFSLLLSHRLHYLPSPTVHFLTLSSLTGNSGQIQSVYPHPPPQPWTDAFRYFPSFLHNKNLPLIIECSCCDFFTVSPHIDCSFSCPVLSMPGQCLLVSGSPGSPSGGLA